MSHTESDFFCWGGGLKKADACGFFGVSLWLLVDMWYLCCCCGSCAAVLPAVAVGLLW